MSKFILKSVKQNLSRLIHLNGKKLYQSDSFKYLANTDQSNVIQNKTLSSHKSSKIKLFFNFRFTFILWFEQNSSSIKRQPILQKIVFKLILFWKRNFSTVSTIKNSKFDKGAVGNFLLISHFFTKRESSLWLFILSFQFHKYNTIWTSQGWINAPFYRNKTNDRDSLSMNAIYIWIHPFTHSSNHPLTHSLKLWKYFKGIW